MKMRKPKQNRQNRNTTLSGFMFWMFFMGASLRTKQTLVAMTDGHQRAIRRFDEIDIPVALQVLQDSFSGSGNAAPLGLLVEKQDLTAMVVMDDGAILNQGINDGFRNAALLHAHLCMLGYR